ncbi:mitochondrial import receptor subunit TOM6 homolog [Glandiceps talaboti]
MAPEKALPAPKARPGAGIVASVKDLYKNPTKRQFVRNLLLFGVGIWLAREFADVDVMGSPQPVA